MAVDGSQSISVIIPVLNNAEGLERCLSSVFAQNYNELEIIIIDGGSNDGTLDVIKKHESKINYWESGEDSGISSAFNRGLRVTTGELVAILNSDDQWANTTVESVLKFAESDPLADLYCGQIRFLDMTTGRSYLRSPSLERMSKRMNLFHPAMFVRRQCYQTVGPYNESYSMAMDAEWIHRAIKLRMRFSIVDKVLATMSLQGRSDLNYGVSLREYKRSLLSHGLSSNFNANLYYVIFWALKSFTRFLPIRLIKQFLFR
tara:strand:+ start:266 stop:1045 length:780 start_codon:yes stop_codon:yes gene_type:complete